MQRQSYRILLAAEAATKNPKYAVTAPAIKEILKANKLVVGSVVKIWVEAVGKPKPAPEELWLVIHAIKRRMIRGIVNTRPERSLWHGLYYDSVVEFKDNCIIDISISGAKMVGIRQ